MPEKAYILVETEAGKSRDVATALAKVQGVKTADVITGPYDVMVTVEARNLELLGSTVTSKIQTVPGVIRTLTCLTVPVSSSSRQKKR